jgi:GTP cyclohydrolase II
MTKEKEGTDAAISELKKEVTDLKKDIETANVTTQKEINARRKVEYTTFIKEKNVPGDVDKMVATLIKLRESDKDAFKSYKESLEEMGKTLSASGFFVEVGGQGDGNAGDSAYIKLQKEKVDVMKKDTTLSENDAWRIVIKDKAELYKEYTKERKAAARTSNE